MTDIITPSCLLNVDNLSLSIGSNELVKAISFQLHQGERVCLLGASGSGKSLTARALSGTLPANTHVSGKIIINGHDVTHQPILKRPSLGRIATVFQDSFGALNPLMTVGKQLSLSTHVRSHTALSSLLTQMGIPDSETLLSRLPAELSGGQRQRLCIAFALLSGANLLIADEPTTALDVLNQQQVVDLLKQCTNHKSCNHSEHLHGKPLSLLFITHDIHVAAQLCERAIVLYDGQIVEQSSMENLLTHPQHPYTQRLVAAVQNTDEYIAPFIHQVQQA
ncbi:MAG: ATP-binding cassette domain-containing protein [Vibrio sp.]